MGLMRDKRKSKGLTLAQISALTGLAQGSLSKIETGKMAARVVTLRKIAAVLDVDWRDLVEE